MQPLMQTDSEQLLHAGVSVGVETFEAFLQESKHQRSTFDASVCHQVGGAHRKLMLESLDLPIEQDFSTFHWLGNTGSVALPTALAMGLASGRLKAGQSIALLGIGSGINSVMMSTRWQHPIVAGDLDAVALRHLGMEKPSMLVNALRNDLAHTSAEMHHPKSSKPFADFHQHAEKMSES